MKNNLLTLFLSPYKKETQFLQSFEIIKNKGYGTFKTTSNFYCSENKPVEHFSAVELQICLNQLLYLYFAHLNLFDKSTFSNKETFVEQLNKNNFITEQTMHFKKPIDVSSSFQGVIEVLKSKKIKNTVFMECLYTFEMNCYGTVKVAHIIEN